MENYRAIPPGYMKVGDLAKKTDVTVRTLQYYDKIGLLSPSSESEGGFRLYTDKDMAKLIQILTMKQLGFSLNEIKARLKSIDTPEDMVNALAEHALSIRERIDALTKSLAEIEALKAEVTQMKTMDFKKYSAILLSLQLKNDHYWAIKHFDDDVMDYFGSQFGNNKELAYEIIEKLNGANKDAYQLLKAGIPPESEEGQLYAKTFWELILELTDGDMDLINKISRLIQKSNNLDDEWELYQFTAAALNEYFTKQGHNPIDEDSTS